MDNNLSKEKFCNVVLLGEPNCGKSSFINNLTDYKACMISPKPHTTRELTLAVYTKDQYQIAFLDTPGISFSKKKDIKELTRIAQKSISKADLCVFMLDVSKKHIPYHITELANQVQKPKIIILNKIDLVSKGKLLSITADLSHSFTQIFYLSNTTLFGLDRIKQFLLNSCTEQEWRFLSQTQTTRSLEQLTSDRTQEVIFQQLYEEVPYKSHVVTEPVIYNKDESISIYQTIHVLPAHKHIFVGRIKALSVAARINITKFFKKKAHVFITIRAK